MVAVAFLRYGLLREAATAAERAVQMNPAYDDLRVELGDLYVRIGLPERAREQYRDVLARQPAHQAAARGLRVVSGLPSPG
jgi:tetratricopeptide (TPR) repeat protein